MLDFIKLHKADLYLTLAILFSALLLRIPAFDFPDTTIGDEGVAIYFTTTTINRIPFFEPSPPLSWMIYRVLVPQLEVGFPKWYVINYHREFFDYPYKQIRLAEIYIGVLIVLELYLIARLLGGSKYLSATLAFLGVLDNMLIMFSRTMNPDNFLIFFGLTGILILALTLRFKHWINQLLGFLIGGFILGLPFAVKFNGLGFMAAGLVFLLLKKKWKFIPVVLLAGTFAYFATFYVYFGMMNKGPVDMQRSFYDTKLIRSFSFPGPESGLVERLDSAVEYTKIAYMTHTGDEGEVDRRVLNYAGSAFRWPLSMSNLIAWFPGGYARFMVLFGNPLVWAVAFLSVLTALFDLIRSALKKIPTDKTSLFLVVAVLGNYLPFILVSRRLFMYSYLPSLLFSLLLVPKAFAVLRPYIEVKLKDVSREGVERLFFYVLIFMASLVFLSVSPMTYGY